MLPLRTLPALFILPMVACAAPLGTPASADSDDKASIERLATCPDAPIDSCDSSLESAVGSWVLDKVCAPDAQFQQLVCDGYSVEVDLSQLDVDSSIHVGADGMVELHFAVNGTGSREIPQACLESSGRTCEQVAEIAGEHCEVLDESGACVCTQEVSQNDDGTAPWGVQEACVVGDQMFLARADFGYLRYVRQAPADAAPEE